MTKEYLKLEQSGADFMELEKLTLGSLKKAVIDGDVVNGTLMAGQIAGLIKSEESCEDIVKGIVREAEQLLKL
jgi:enoyl-[acyl-carrier protein] reductase II